MLLALITRRCSGFRIEFDLEIESDGIKDLYDQWSVKKGLK